MATLSSLPSIAASTMARVNLRFIRWPAPNAPPTQPVFTRKHLTLCSRILSPSILAYTSGDLGRKGAPKHELNVAEGSLPNPRSVPANLAV